MSGLFDPISFGGVTLKNRIMVSPMCQYQASETGHASQWHHVHYGALSLGGAGLMMLEATAVEARGRISSHDLGLFEDSQKQDLQQIAAFAHTWGAKIGVQLAHAGRKAMVDGEIVAPSAIAFSDRYKQPIELSSQELVSIVDAFVNAAKRAYDIGFDVIELHAAHGYLLHQFLSPLSNHRTDEFGGTLEKRMYFPLQVVRAVRNVLPNDFPLFIRVSGTEYVSDGYSLEDMVAYCQAFKEAGVDVIDVSSGGNISSLPPKIYAGYQVPLAEKIRADVGIPVVAVGLLDDPILADAVLQEERADIIAIGRGFLRNPHFAHAAAKALQAKVEPPKPYERAY